MAVPRLPHLVACSEGPVRWEPVMQVMHEGGEQMSEVSTVPVAYLEELLDQEIPCGGIAFRPLARSCSNSAVLHSDGHGHGFDTAPYRYKCMTCWQDWYQEHLRRLIVRGYILCGDCHQGFDSIEAFSDYRPF